MTRTRKIVRACKLAVVMLSASVPFHAGAAAKFNALDPLGTATNPKVASKPAVSIEVALGDWGSADVRDIQRVLDSVAAEFLAYVKPTRDDIKIRVIPRGGSPRVLYEKDADGEYVIQLTARDERWFQYAYQFAHELCHVFSNFDHKNAADGGKVAEGNQWFEESLCETASLFVMKRLAVAWEATPPNRNWAGYGPVLTAYSKRLSGEPHRQLAAGQTFQDWYGANKDTLTSSPYLRDKNELVAAQLLPLFEAQPELWHAIIYLNPSKASAGKSFARYLADWEGASPEKTLPNEVRDLFGVTTAANLAGVESGTSPPVEPSATQGEPQPSIAGPVGDR